MTTQRLIMMKPAFLEGIMALPAKEVMQIMAKIDLLRQDPLPDGKLKKHLTHLTGKPYRIRSGDFRILYKFDHASVNVLTIRRRDESTYKQSITADDDFDLDVAEDLEAPTGDALPTSNGLRPWERYNLSQETQDKLLPEPITLELLNTLRVPATCHQRLLPLKTQNELLSCPGIPDEILLRIDQYMFDLPLLQIEQQQNLVLNETNDLLKYKEGELLTFLLKLSPEQEKYVHWSPNTSGPTLVKGGPGTGKSTIALYRTRSLLAQLLRTSKTAPRLLFTTYTNALVKSSEQLLQQLLGDNAQYVRVQTADKLAYDILHSYSQVKEIASHDQQIAFLVQAIATTPLTGNVLQQQAQRQTLDRIGNDYLLQELNSVIVARQITTREAYLATSRSGRKVRLNTTQRQLIWRIYERWHDLLQASGKETWQQRRARAEAIVEHSDQYQRYDAVVIDEAQDLDPSLLRLLIKLCKTTNRLFITADANQSIYGSGFTWNDVHQSLKFQGRTSILRANYRSTYEIGEAAQSYLSSGLLDSEATDRHYINNGPLPDVRSVLNADHEAQLLASFFKKACSGLRLTIGSCAVLCPGERVGKAIAASLHALNLEATFMSGQDLNLTRPGIKIITLNSAKGLEFPIVALAGFVSSSYPIIPHDAAPEEQAETLARERRTIFVGMTRAMRALLVILPATIKTPLLQGFDPTYWNTSSKI